jgi:hypothetical protein
LMSKKERGICVVSDSYKIVGGKGGGGWREMRDKTRLRTGGGNPLWKGCETRKKGYIMGFTWPGFRAIKVKFL